MSYNSDIAVTVYCIVYNHEKYLRDALDGFIMQKTNFKFEVLVHDDASTDNSAGIIHEYELKYPDIIKPIYQKENIYSRGVNRTFEYMLPKTRGKYIAWCEGDDYWTSPDKLQKQYDYMEQHPECSLVAHEALTFNCHTGKTKKYTVHDFSKLENCELSTAEIIDNHLLFPTASMFYRKEYYIKNEEFLKTVKGFDYVMKILLSSEGIVHIIPECMSVYRFQTEGSWTYDVSISNEKFLKHTQLAIENLEKINAYTNYKYDAEIKKNSVKRMYQAYINAFNFKELKKEPYLSIYKKLSVKKRIFLHIRKYFPFLYKLKTH